MASPLARALRRTMTEPERRLWRDMRNRGLAGVKVVRQFPIGPYVADFCARSCRLVIEIDGATHSTEAEREHDRRRTLFLEQAGYRVIRFQNAEVMESLDDVLDQIFHVVTGGT